MLIEQAEKLESNQKWLAIIIIATVIGTILKLILKI